MRRERREKCFIVVNYFSSKLCSAQRLWKWTTIENKTEQQQSSTLSLDCNGHNFYFSAFQSTKIKDATLDYTVPLPIESMNQFSAFLACFDILHIRESHCLESTALLVFPYPLGYLEHLFISPPLGRNQMFLQRVINLDHNWSGLEIHLQLMHAPIFCEDMTKFQAGLGWGKTIFEIT